MRVLSAYGEDLLVTVTADKGYATQIQKTIEGSVETSVPVPKLGKLGLKAAGSSGKTLFTHIRAEDLNLQNLMNEIKFLISETSPLDFRWPS